jgi:hypothetical protein
MVQMGLINYFVIAKVKYIEITPALVLPFWIKVAKGEAIM